MYDAERNMSMADIEYMKMLAEKFEKGEIPFLEEKDQFEFACDQCGKCCRNRSDILLSPLDVYHLSIAKGMTCKQIIEKYGDRYVGSHSNLPVVRLKYREEPNGQTTCYFLGRKDGKFFCRVDEHKPTVCRTYPLGKMQSMKQDEVLKGPVLPRYFLQDEAPHNECIGLKRAHKEHILQTVVDWVGGAYKKSVSDRYSAIFNEFTQAYHKAMNYKKFEKMANPVAFSIYFGVLENAMYADYDDCRDDESFLEKLEFNLAICVDIARRTCEDPNFMLKAIERGFDKHSDKDAI